MSTSFFPGRWNKHPDYLKAHYVGAIAHVTRVTEPVDSSFTADCGIVLSGTWEEWKMTDLGRVPLCEECKARVHAK